MSNASPTRDNPNPPALAPREAKGALVGDAAPPTAAPPPKIRGYAPPIVDAAPSSAPVAELPRLWLSFWFDGKALRCEAALQRKALQRVQFDPSDPVIAQGYTYFVRQVVALLDGGAVLAPAAPAPAPAELEQEDEPESELEQKTKPESSVPPTNPNP